MLSWHFQTHKANGWTDLSHKSSNASDKYPTIHHFVAEMCMYKMCIVGYGTGALWDLWDWWPNLCWYHSQAIVKVTEDSHIVLTDSDGSKLKTFQRALQDQISHTVETLYSTIYYSKYFIELNFDKSTQYVALWIHKRHPISRPFGRAMECLLWVLQQKLTVL